jgi:hypothetical protein
MGSGTRPSRAVNRREGSCSLSAGVTLGICGKESIIWFTSIEKTENFPPEFAYALREGISTPQRATGNNLSGETERNESMMPP